MDLFDGAEYNQINRVTNPLPPQALLVPMVTAIVNLSGGKVGFSVCQSMALSTDLRPRS